MPAYVVSMMSIHDPKTYKKYTDRTPPIVKRHGGKFLTRGDDVTTLEGEPCLIKSRWLFLSFPPNSQILDWMADPEYQDAMTLPSCFIRGTICCKRDISRHLRSRS